MLAALAVDSDLLMVLQFLRGLQRLILPGSTFEVVAAVQLQLLLNFLGMQSSGLCIHVGQHMIGGTPSPRIIMFCLFRPYID